MANTGIHLLEKNLPDAKVPVLEDEPPSDDPFPLPAACGDDYTQNLDRMNRINGFIAQTYSIVRPHKPSFAPKSWAGGRPSPSKARFLVRVGALFHVLVCWALSGPAPASTSSKCRQPLPPLISPIAIQAVDTLLPFPHQHEKAPSEFSFGIPLAPPLGFPW